MITPTFTCEECGTRRAAPSRGRPPRFCSTRCRARNFREAPQRRADAWFDSLTAEQQHAELEWAARNGREAARAAMGEHFGLSPEVAEELAAAASAAHKIQAIEKALELAGIDSGLGAVEAVEMLIEVSTRLRDICGSSALRMRRRADELQGSEPASAAALREEARRLLDERLAAPGGAL